MGESIAMVQSDHRNASLIHSHIAVLLFVFFPLHIAMFFYPIQNGF